MRKHRIRRKERGAEARIAAARIERMWQPEQFAERGVVSID